MSRVLHRSAFIAACVLVGAVYAWGLVTVVRDALGTTTYRGTYYTAIGPENREITKAEYDAFVVSRSCLPRSHVRVWEDDHEVQHVCEL